MRLVLIKQIGNYSLTVKLLIVIQNIRSSYANV